MNRAASVSGTWCCTTFVVTFQQSKDCYCCDIFALPVKKNDTSSFGSVQHKQRLMFLIPAALFAVVTNIICTEGKRPLSIPLSDITDVIMLS